MLPFNLKQIAPARAPLAGPVLALSGSRGPGGAPAVPAQAAPRASPEPGPDPRRSPPGVTVYLPQRRC